MSVIPGFVKKRASKEFNRGYSPKKILKGFLGVTLLVSVANAGNVKDGLVNWMGDRGGDTANGAELVGGAVVAGGDVLVEGGKNAADTFGQEFDGDLPDVPSLDVSLSGNGSHESGDIGYIIKSGDSYYSVLGHFGMSQVEIADCNTRVNLSNQPVLIPGQTFNNPC